MIGGGGLVDDPLYTRGLRMLGGGPSSVCKLNRKTATKTLNNVTTTAKDY